MFQFETEMATMKIQSFPHQQHQFSLIQTAATSDSAVESTFASDAAFIEIEQRLATEKTALMKKINGVFCFELSDGPGGAKGVWFIDAKTAGQIYRGKQDGMKADCTIKMKDGDCIKLLTGKLNPQAAFLQGKVKISGNMGMAMKLQSLQGKVKAKLWGHNVVVIGSSTY